jgi:hypothetical protein
MYNSSDHDVYHMAVEMQRDVLEQIQVLWGSLCFIKGEVKIYSKEGFILKIGRVLWFLLRIGIRDTRI